MGQGPDGTTAEKTLQRQSATFDKWHRSPHGITHPKAAEQATPADAAEPASPGRQRRPPWGDGAEGDSGGIHKLVRSFQISGNSTTSSMRRR